jgi:hypothetical protein
MSRKKLTPYDVGYARPPEHSQFKKGQSGNPKGRPKGVLNLATLYNRALGEKVTITENGRRKTITKLEIALKQLINKAAQGDPRAMHLTLSMASLVGVEAPSAHADLDANESVVMAGLLTRLKAADPPSVTKPARQSRAKPAASPTRTSSLKPRKVIR